jgi:hypothetical protein
MDFNSFFFRQPKPTYTAVSISLLPSSELIWVSKAYESSEVVSCSMIDDITCRLFANGEKHQCSQDTGFAEQGRATFLEVLGVFSCNGRRYVTTTHYCSKDAYDFIFPLKTKFGVNIVLVEYPGYGIYTNHNVTHLSLR